MATTDIPPPETADLRQYLGVIRTRKWSILGVTALVFASAMFFSFRQVPIYESTSKVLVKPPVSPTQIAGSSATQVDLETEREIAQSLEVAIRASENIQPAENPRDLIEQRLEVTVPGDTQVLVFTFSDPSPLRARQGADAFTNAYLQYKREQGTQAIDELRAPLQNQIDELTQQLRDLDRQIADQPAGASANQQSQHDILTGQLAVLRSQLAPLNSIVVDPGDVIEMAELPSEAASPNHLLNAALGLFVGLAFGVGLAFLRERLDDRLQGRGDLEARTGAPVLAVIPRVPSKRKEAPRVVTLEEPKSAAAEAYRALRTSVMFSAAQRGLQVIMVASASSGEGKSTTAANLAAVLAATDRRVVLVSADLRKPRLARYFGLDNSIGLVDVLAGDASLSTALRDPGVDNLRVLASGPIPAAPAELLGSEAMGEVLDDLRSLADFVIVDTPAVLPVTDALILAPLVDGVVYLAHAEETTRGAVEHAMAQLEQVGARVIGAVLNGYDPARARGYPAYRYYYQYRYVEPNGKGRELPEGRGDRSTTPRAGQWT